MYICMEAATFYPRYIGAYPGVGTCPGHYGERSDGSINTKTLCEQLDKAMIVYTNWLAIANTLSYIVKKL